MTPADHGYLQCDRCGTWRTKDAVGTPASAGYLGHPPPAMTVCLDVAWCSAQAGAGKGLLDADTGAPTVPDDAWTKGSVP